MNDLPTGLRLYRNQLRDAVARDLAHGRRASPRPRWALRVAASTAALAAGAVAAVVLLTGGPQASPADAAILRNVATALTAPAGTILHERAMVSLGGAPATRYELWAQAEVPYAYRVVKFGHEGSWDGSAYSDFDPRSNTLVVQSGGQAGGRSARDDAAAVLRSLVESGNANIDAETTFEGVLAYRLTVSGAEPHYLNGTVFVARADYRPLQIETSVDTQTGRAQETIRYETYEYLPGTAANRRLLDLSAQHPGARIVQAGSPGEKPVVAAK
jgi:hypothetical protein